MAKSMLLTTTSNNIYVLDAYGGEKSVTTLNNIQESLDQAITILQVCVNKLKTKVGEETLVPSFHDT
ncbi:hypothetical protein NC652_003560 [Populus alba x Populus x berolinensis]|nr:hypothetical protein NC652_003560 [Populus alba x Populus x berolinensis]